MNISKLKVTLNTTKLLRRHVSTKWSYQHNATTTPLLGLTTGQRLEETASKFRDRPAVISAFEKKTLSYGDLLEKADKFAAALRKLHLQKGDLVGIWSPNCASWIVASLACARSGLVALLLNYSYKASELQYCVNKVGAKAIICGKSHPRQNYYGIIESLDEDIFKNGQRIATKTMPSLQSVISMDENLKGVYNFDEILNGVEQSEVKKIKDNQKDVQIDDYLNIQFTSGSTGNPKAVVLTHHNVVNNGYFMGKRLEMDKRDYRVCVQVPLFHTFGTTGAISGSVNFGTTMVLPFDLYNAEKALFCIKQQNCNLIFGTPTMYVDLVNQQKKHKLDIEPEACLIGGSPAPNQLLNDMYDVLKIKTVLKLYGLTETTAAAYLSKIGSTREMIIDRTGHLSDHEEAKVVDGNNQVVPMGTPGELLVRGYCNMVEYFGDPEKTESIFGKDRWLRTGDLFVMFEDGTGRVVGRIKDIIIRGGENIQPEEIENLICLHPNVIDCRVVGLPHDRLGEEVCACVRVKAGQTFTLEDVRNHCKDKISHFKIPSKLHIFAQFPTTTSGKIQKFKLIEELIGKRNIS